MSDRPEVTQRELSAVLADPAVSLAAKGVLWLLLLRPPGTVLTRGELFARNADQMAAIDQAIDELARAGLVAKVSPRKRSQGRRSGGVRLPARVAQPQPQPALGSASVFGARPAPSREERWWETWKVPVAEVTVLRPFKGRMVEREGR